MTNPRWCRHSVAKVVSGFDSHEAICVSCDTEITEEMWLKKNYEFDKNHELWVHTPISKRSYGTASNLYILDEGADFDGDTKTHP